MGTRTGELFGDESRSGTRVRYPPGVGLFSKNKSQAWNSLLRKYPEIIPRTIQYLESKVSSTESGEQQEYEEWMRILEHMSFERLRNFLESDTERATRLRQSLPFWQVLTKDERDELEKMRSTEDLK